MHFPEVEGRGLKGAVEAFPGDSAHVTPKFLLPPFHVLSEETNLMKFQALEKHRSAKDPLMVLSSPGGHEQQGARAASVLKTLRRPSRFSTQ